MANNRVLYGLMNVHYAVWDEEQSKYLAPVPVKGAVSLSASPEGDSSIFYADNTPYWSYETNGGWTGDINIAVAEQQMLIDLLGYTKDKNGMLIEQTTAKPKTFALLFEVQSNTKDVRTVYYNCSLSRPEQEANTTTDTTDPDTQTLNITMIARDFEGFNATVRGSLELDETTKEAYEGFFTEVLLPEKVAA